MMRYLLILLLISGSCAPLYVQNSRNSPLLEEKGEFFATAGIGTGIDFQSAYAVGNHLGVMVNGYYLNQEGEGLFAVQPNSYRIKHRIIESGIGYFTSPSNKTTFEVYTGFGRGKGSGQDNSATSILILVSDTVNTKSEYDRWFIQPAFGIHLNSISISVASRVSIINFRMAEITSGETKYPFTSRPVVFIEPALTFQWRVNSLGFIVFSQIGFNAPLSSVYQSESMYTGVNYINTSIGIGYRLKR